MVEIEDKLISDEIFTECFSCDIKKCKGICCIEGDSGAPLKIEEIDIIEEELENILPFMSDAGRNAVAQNGVFEVDIDGDYTTALVDGGECAFVTMEDGIALCAIEKAWRAGKTHFMKPISCHLYPIRAKEFGNGMTGLNYHRWDVCSDAVCNGKKCGAKIYESLKGAIERAFGEQFYEYLEDAAGIIERGEVEEEK